MGYREFPDVNRIGRPKAEISIPILLGHYKQLHTRFINGYIITWILQQIFILSNKVKHAAG